MNFKTILSLLCLLYSICNSQTPTVYISDNFYLVTGVPNTFADANSYCLSTYGTSLGNIYSSELQNEINDLMTSISYSGVAWIYYNDIATEGIFRWCDGTSGGYTNWYSNQPDNYANNEDCVLIDAGFDYKWFDSSCSNQNNFICRRITPSPTKSPTNSPTYLPTNSPTKSPSYSPTKKPTKSPTKKPTKVPTSSPTISPTPYFETPSCWTGNHLIYCKTETLDGLPWLAANTYCKDTYGTSLASILNPSHTTDGIQLQTNINDNLLAWIGLNRISTSDPFKWVDTTPVSYVNWNTNQPNNNGICTTVPSNGTWNALSCTAQIRAFYCNKPLPPNNSYTPTRKYIAVKDSKNYANAQDYCLTNYGTTLATVASVNDKDEMSFPFFPDTSWMWIGLYKSGSNWVWQDGTPYSYTNWLPSQPSGDGMCTSAIPSGSWNDVGCTATQYFVCNAY